MELNERKGVLIANNGIVTNRSKSENFLDDTKGKASSGMQQLKSQLEENIPVNSAMENLRKVEETAGSFWSGFGSTVNGFLDQALQISPKEDDVSTPTHEASSSVFLNRHERQLLELVQNENTFTQIISEPSHGITFESWEKEISIDGKTEEISLLLEEYPDLRKQMESLVPSEVSYDDFWKRFFWHKEVVQPIKAIQSGNDEEEIFSWGDERSDEEESDNEQVNDEKKQSSEEDTTENNSAAEVIDETVNDLESAVSKGLQIETQPASHDGEVDGEVKEEEENKVSSSSNIEASQSSLEVKDEANRKVDDDDEDDDDWE